MLLFWGVAWGATLELVPGDDLVGLSESLQPGDELVLADGLYQVRGQIVWSVLSTEDAPLTMRPAEGAEPVIELIPDEKGAYDNDILQIEDSSWVVVEGITFQGSVDWTDDTQNHRGVQIVNSSHVTLSGVTVMQTGDHSLYLAGTNSNITVQDSHIHSTLSGYGVYVGCSDASCWTSDSRLTNNWIHSIGGESSWSVYLAHGSQGITLSDNVIYGSAGYGVYMGSTEYGDRNIFEGNAVWGLSGYGLYVQGGARIRNNILFNIDGTGIYSRDPERGTYSDLIISFNTVAQTTGWATLLEDWYEQFGMVLANNAICNPTGYGLYYEMPTIDTATPASDNVVTSNVACGLVDGLDEFPDAVTPGAGYSDFVDVETWDFYPASSDSILVGTADPAGDTYVPEADFNGLARDGDSPEVGAYEWSGTGNPGWAIQEGFKEFGEGREVIEETVGGGCCQDDGSGSAALLLTPLIAIGALRRRRRR
jgi:hypothetical protein